jgi:kynurenine formamidase
MREAKHPDHINDVRAALVFLQAKYGFGADYIILGHSAGGTLAMQLLMGTGTGAGALQMPSAMVCISGIYNLVGLAQRLGPVYHEFISGAFGKDELAWADAAPLKYSGGSFGDLWSGNRKPLVLAWSGDDELIDEPEIDDMAGRLVSDGVSTLVVVKDLKGSHDGLWEDGEPLAHLIWRALDELQS